MSLPMYDGIVNSPITTLSSTITDTDTTIPVTDITCFPDGPSEATIGRGTLAETVLYTTRNVPSSQLEGVTRAFQGVAAGWSAGTIISRVYTEYDYSAQNYNITNIDGGSP